MSRFINRLVAVAVTALLVGSAILLVGMADAIGQPPGKGKGPQPPPDEQKDILDQIKEAYKAQYEVHEDVLKELRKLYQQPSADREAKIFKELRRLYLLTDERERAILWEIRKAYQQPSAEQEERVFREIAKAERLPEGAVAPSIQAEQAGKLFRKRDLNGDGLLGADEMPDVLRGERARWDGNRDGFIDLDEYGAYYQGRLRSLAAAVASGQIELRPGSGGPARSAVPVGGEEPRPAVYRAGKLPPGLPDWFIKLDTDGDAQIGLYEWRKSSRPLQEFLDMDRNGDGFATIDELMRYLARSGTSTVNPGGRR